MIVTIKVVEVGQRFACRGVLYDNLTEVASTRDYPYGFTGSAYDAAVQLAAKKGWKIAPVEKAQTKPRP